MTNIANLFNFISSKKPEYKTPFKAKLIYEPESITDDELTVDNSLYLYNTPITSLPDNLTIEDNFDLSNTSIISLPDNLTIGGNLNLQNTKIASLPYRLKVNGYIYVYNTPLSKHYPEDEIRKIIQDKGGSVKGNIII